MGMGNFRNLNLIIYIFLNCAEPADKVNFLGQNWRALGIFFGSKDFPINLIANSIVESLRLFPDF